MQKDLSLARGHKDIAHIIFKSFIVLPFIFLHLELSLCVCREAEVILVGLEVGRRRAVALSQALWARGPGSGPQTDHRIRTKDEASCGNVRSMNEEGEFKKGGQALTNPAIFSIKAPRLKAPWKPLQR